MVVSGYVSCITCNKVYFVRIGLGTETYHVHSFDCLGCNLSVDIGLRRHDKGGQFQAAGNARLAHEVHSDAVVINLHASFAFDQDSKHDRTAFPSLMYMAKIYPFLKKDLVAKKFNDLSTVFEVPNTKDTWYVVRNLLLLVEQGRNDKAGKLLDNYKALRKKYVENVEVNSFCEVVRNFFDAIFYPRFTNALNSVEKAMQMARDQHPEIYNAFISYYKANHWAETFQRSMSLFSDYFECFTEFNQILVHARIDDQNVDDLVVGSKRFERVKLMYGQAFETLTTEFTFLACVNNVIDGRDFDEFKSMSLNKYIHDVEKAKRANPFISRPEFSPFTGNLDSTLRNGSHHASIWREGEKIFFRSGGAGAQKDYPYSRYLHLCNELVVAFAALFVAEYSAIRDE